MIRMREFSARLRRQRNLDSRFLRVGFFKLITGIASAGSPPFSVCEHNAGRRLRRYDREKLTGRAN